MSTWPGKEASRPYTSLDNVMSPDLKKPRDPVHLRMTPVFEQHPKQKILSPVERSHEVERENPIDTSFKTCKHQSIGGVVARHACLTCDHLCRYNSNPAFDALAQGGGRVQGIYAQQEATRGCCFRFQPFRPATARKNIIVSE